jgi:F-type H+-transporting ATPase subunit epsilon
MRLLLVTPERQLLDTDIEEVYAPGVNGQFGVLPEHVNFLTALGTGELRYRTHGVDHYVAVSGGILEVKDDVVTVLADSAEPAEEIDAERAALAEKRAQEQLTVLTFGTAEYVEVRAAIDRATTRRQVAAHTR